MYVLLFISSLCLHVKLLMWVCLVSLFNWNLFGIVMRVNLWLTFCIYIYIILIIYIVIYIYMNYIFIYIYIFIIYIYIYLFNYIYIQLYIYIHEYHNKTECIFGRSSQHQAANCFHEESILSVCGICAARIYLLFYKITDRILYIYTYVCVYIYNILNTHSILFMYVHIYACMYTFSSEENWGKWMKFLHNVQTYPFFIELDEGKFTGKPYIWW